MERWDVVLVIISLVGLITAIIGPVLKLTRAITELTITMRAMEKQVADLTERNAESHKRLWAHNAEQDKTLNGHELRIGALENKSK